MERTFTVRAAKIFMLQLNPRGFFQWRYFLINILLLKQVIVNNHFYPVRQIVGFFGFRSLTLKSYQKTRTDHRLIFGILYHTTDNMYDAFCRCLGCRDHRLNQGR